MMIIDMTAQLGSLMVGLDAVLVFAASAIAISLWQGQRASFPSRVAGKASKLAIVGRSPSAPAPTGEAPSHSSVPEAA